VSIKTVETENEGLKRAFMLTIPAQDIEARVDQEVKRIAPQIRMPGFRPGKVPANLIRKMHGDAIRREALDGAVQDGVQQLLKEQNVRPALQPQVELDEQYEPGKDAEIHVTVESLPDVPAPQIEGLTLDRLTVTADDSDVDAQIAELASQSKRWSDAPKKHAAEAGDLVVIDFEGKVGPKAFEGGKGEDMSVELGSGRLIPGFEDQLVGAKAGDEREVKVTFPDDYPAKDLAGKAATFAVSVKAVKTGGANAIDEEFAKSLGLQSLDQLRQVLRDQRQNELGQLTRTHMKRQLLDQLAARHDFVVPETMVEAEYQNILGQLRHEASHEADSEAALAEIAKDADEYRRIAERRVRLGLLLSEIGAANGVVVSDQEMQRLIMNAASQYQGKDRENFLRYVEQEPMAAAQLRAPLYEDKVVDFLFSTATINDREATRAELEADLESEEGHVHGPGCGHDHAAPAAKGKAKKAAAKQSAPKDEQASKPAKPAKAKSAPAADAQAGAAKATPEPAKPIKDGAGRKAPSAKPAKAEAKPAAARAKAAAKPAAKKAPAKKK
jgi:trigger factor